MEPRTIAVGLVAVIAAFAAAFAISSSGKGGEKTATAGPGTKATTIKAAAPAAVTGVEVGGTIPALKAEPKKHVKKHAAKKQAASSPSSSAPSTQNTTTTQSTPSTQNTTTTTTTTTQSAPVVSAPAKPKPKPAAPVSSGGQDG